MTPKEEANRLGNLFYRGSVFDYNKEEHTKEKIEAKKQAIICAKELQNEAHSEKHSYYNKVIIEIDKL